MDEQRDKKTVSRLLRPEKVDLLEEWIENKRKLEVIVRQMEELSQKDLRLHFKSGKKSKRDSLPSVYFAGRNLQSDLRKVGYRNYIR